MGTIEQENYFLSSNKKEVHHEHSGQQIVADIDQVSEHCCYILYNTKTQFTYNGYTNNITRRLRQHNGEIKGGAKCTTRACQKQGVVWQYLAIVTSPELTYTKALSFEWHTRYPSGKRPREKIFQGPIGRLDGMFKALQHNKFKDMKFRVLVAEPYFEHCFNRMNACPNIVLIRMEKPV